MGKMSKIGEKGAPVAQIGAKSDAGRLHAWDETSQLPATHPRAGPVGADEVSPGQVRVSERSPELVAK